MQQIVLLVLVVEIIHLLVLVLMVLMMMGINVKAVISNVQHAVMLQPALNVLPLDQLLLLVIALQDIMIQEYRNVMHVHLNAYNV